ncbi:ATP-dependent RNA helicase mrh4 [Penicillium longicatenatum]|jgi:ATP-dependent RNA helicase MRH4|uniref:ATP-dependent RNA helicase mrh4 n=1 Tax=Penicillium longicatenatum TaxID=1561947 RepID=UPI0025477653|nr:ATP-dependent RNA helicase mrh4 [Penicillium longicatenatum]KAJ5657878.1 ATP-dependent RNA helicase mrh4 [Penicillium longicatenatum]KAJ5663554.1 ATP-dependent RNA helicase mrh4 [Penicillium longicatenatum]
MATARLRRKASRMALSPDVAKHTLKKKRSGPAGPFASMNQTEARIPDAPRSRSQAALRRSGDDNKSKKPESPLYKALKMQTTLSPVTYGRRTAIKSKIANVTSFDHMPLLPAVRQSIFTQALPGLADVVPTPIQRLAIPQLLSQKPNKKTAAKETDDEFQYDQFLLAAETGSGKTLAYLLPVVDAVKRAETLDKQEEKLLEEEKAKEREERLKTRTYDLEPEVAPLTNEGRPRAIILVPTSELVAQVGEKVKALAHTVKYRSGIISSNLTPRRIKNTLFHPDGIDILVSTPHLLASIAKTNPYVLSRVSHLVLDEADSLMDRSFIPTTMEVVDKAAPSLKKLIFCSATIPKSLDTQIRKRYPDVKRLTTPNLHAIPRRVQLGVVDIDKEPYRGNRMLACADVIWSIGKAGDGTDGETFGPVLSKYMGPKVKKIIVFVNEREEADEVAQFLQTKGIDATSLSRDSSSRKQQEILAEFTDVEKPPSSEDILLARKQHRMEKEIPLELPDLRSQMTRRLPNTRVLVTTDIASRGIDTLAVKTVVLYHVPHTTIDFIHRLGRLGRMGKRGRGVVLVGKKDRKDVVREVREGMFRGQALI